MTRKAGTEKWEATKWSGVYRRRGLYHGRLYKGKVNGVSQYEWLSGHRTGQAAADALAEARANRVRGQKKGRRHTVASWMKATDDAPQGYWLKLHPRQKKSSNATYHEQTIAFVNEHGDMPLSDVDVELALEWIVVKDKRWTIGGLRAAFTDAKRAGLVDSNPFLGLGISTGPGRKDIVVLTLEEVLELAETAGRLWGARWRAFVLWQAFVGTRPAEAYGLFHDDLDLAAGLVNIMRQRPPGFHNAPREELPLPKNGRTREIVVPPIVVDALRELPTPLRTDTPMWTTNRGKILSGSSQHYYWHPIRCAFGRPALDLYELRHFCGSYLLNVLKLAPQDVAQQLGHRDGGVLVQRLYGHPSEELARERIAGAYTAADRKSVAEISGRRVAAESPGG